MHLEGLPEEKEEDDEGHHDVEEKVDLNGFHIGGGRKGPGYSGVESVCHCNIIVQQPNEKGLNANNYKCKQHLKLFVWVYGFEPQNNNQTKKVC